MVIFILFLTAAGSGLLYDLIYIQKAWRQLGTMWWLYWWLAKMVVQVHIGYMLHRLVMMR